MTSNIGQKEIVQQGAIGFMAREDREATYEKMKDTVLADMKKDFRPEFLNRIDEIIVFHALTENELKEIAKIIISDMQKQVLQREMKLDISEAVKEKVIKDGYDPKFGARPLRRAVQQLLENPLSNEIIAGKFKEGDSIYADVKGNKIFFQKTGSAPAKKEEAKEKPKEAKKEPPKAASKDSTEEKKEKPKKPKSK